MSVSNLVVKQTYSGNGSNLTFAIPFDVLYDSDLETQVYIRDTSGTPVTQTLKTLTSHYTIVGSNVVFVTAPSATDRVVIARSLTLEQALDLQNNADFVPETLETHLDRIVGMIQQLDERIARAPVMQITEQVTDPISLAEPEFGTYLGWNAAGTGLENYTAEEISGFAAQVLTGPFQYLELVNKGSAPPTPTAGNTSIYTKSDSRPYTVNSSGLEKVVDGGLTASGSRAAPNDIVAGTGIVPTAGLWRQVVFIQGSDGAVTVTATPAITAGTIVGQEMVLVGRSDTSTVGLTNVASALELNGDITLGAGGVLGLMWDGTAWIETYRNGL